MLNVSLFARDPCCLFVSYYSLVDCSEIVHCLLIVPYSRLFVRRSVFERIREYQHESTTLAVHTGLNLSGSSESHHLRKIDTSKNATQTNVYHKKA